MSKLFSLSGIRVLFFLIGGLALLFILKTLCFTFFSSQWIQDQTHNLSYKVPLGSDMEISETADQEPFWTFFPGIFSRMSPNLSGYVIHVVSPSFPAGQQSIEEQLAFLQTTYGSRDHFLPVKTGTKKHPLQGFRYSYQTEVGRIQQTVLLATPSGIMSFDFVPMRHPSNPLASLLLYPDGIQSQWLFERLIKSVHLLNTDYIDPSSTYPVAIPLIDCSVPPEGKEVFYIRGFVQDPKTGKQMIDGVWGTFFGNVENALRAAFRSGDCTKEQCETNRCPAVADPFFLDSQEKQDQLFISSQASITSATLTRTSAEDPNQQITLEELKEIFNNMETYSSPKEIGPFCFCLTDS